MVFPLGRGDQFGNVVVAEAPAQSQRPRLGAVGFRGGGRQDFIQVHEFSDSLSISRGKHNFKLGGVYRYNFLNTGGSDVTRGSSSFTGDIAGIPDGFAAFLLGFPVNGLLQLVFYQGPNILRAHKPKVPR